MGQSVKYREIMGKKKAYTCKELQNCKYSFYLSYFFFNKWQKLPQVNSAAIVSKHLHQSKKLNSPNQEEVKGRKEVWRKRENESLPPQSGTGHPAKRAPPLGKAWQVQAVRNLQLLSSSHSNLRVSLKHLRNRGRETLVKPVQGTQLTLGDTANVSLIQKYVTRELQGQYSLTL